MSVDRSEGPTAEQEVEHLAGQCATLLRENERMRICLEWLLENDELTNYGKKTAREALAETV